MKKYKVVGVVLCIVTILAISLSVFCYRKLGYSPYKEIIYRDDGSIGVVVQNYMDEKIPNVIEIPNKYKGRTVSSVKIKTQNVSKIVLPDKLDYFEIHGSGSLKEVVLPSDFKIEGSYINPYCDKLITFIVKDNSVAKQYVIDLGLKYRVEE